MSELFKKATRLAARLKIAIFGPSGSGKSFQALAISTGIIRFDSKFGNRRVAAIDSEKGRLAHYADMFDFDHLVLEEYDPRNYISAAEHASYRDNYAVVLVDSLSHEWAGAGGLLDMTNEIAERSPSKNTWAAFGKTSPLQKKFIKALLDCPSHLVATMRARTQYEHTQEGGKFKPVKIGLEPVQQKETEYEFDLVLRIDMEHKVYVEKSIFPVLDGQVFEAPPVNTRTRETAVESHKKVIEYWINFGYEIAEIALSGAREGKLNVAPSTARTIGSGQAVPSGITADQYNEITSLFDSINADEESRQQAIRRRGAQVIDDLISEAADDLINSLRKLKAIQDAAEPEVESSVKSTDEQWAESQQEIDKIHDSVINGAESEPAQAPKKSKSSKKSRPTKVS